MNEHDIEVSTQKALAFFDRGEQVASTDNFDYAIEMYLEGIKRAPDELELGHIPLRRVALIRQGKGGKKPSMLERLKKRNAKDPLEELINAEGLLAKDPDNLGYAQDMLRAAIKGGWHRTAGWLADLIFSAIRNQDKPNVAELQFLKDCYEKLQKYDLAVAAAMLAAATDPDNGTLADEVKNVSARATMFKGKYDQGKDFSDSIKNKESQELLHAQDAVVKSDDYKAKAVTAARQKLENEPNSYVNRVKLCDALVELGDRESYNEAVALLDKYYRETKDFAYRRHLGEIEIKHLRKKLETARRNYSKNTGDKNLENEVRRLTAELNKLEFDHFELCVKNYPTELKYKYELAIRYLLRRDFDHAIPLFQEVRKEPRLKFFAMNKLGICFFHKAWYDDAIDIFKEAIDSYEINDDDIAKELRYNLARSLEESEKYEEALEVFRKLAQIDFAYKDVSQRIDALRKKQGQ